MVSLIVADVGSISEALSLLGLVPMLGKSKELGARTGRDVQHLHVCIASPYGLSTMTPTGSQICQMVVEGPPRSCPKR